MSLHITTSHATRFETTLNASNLNRTNVFQHQRALFQNAFSSKTDSTLRIDQARILRVECSFKFRGDKKLINMNQLYLSIVFT